MEKIMMSCIVLCNRTIEDERNTYIHYYNPTKFFNDTPKQYEEDDANFLLNKLAINLVI